MHTQSAGESLPSAASASSTNYAVPSKTEPNGGGKSSRFYSLDLLRFAAALSVTVYHYAPLISRSLGGDPNSVASSRFGYLGVELFFMISGFVIALSIQGRSARSFLIHRIVRLYPTFWLALALSGLVAVVVAGEDISARTLAANATMLPGYLGEPFVDGVYWTLGVEWKFYILMSALVAVGLHTRLDRVGTIWSVLLLAVYAGVQLPGLRSAVMFPYGSYFAFGLLVMDTRKNGMSPVRLFGLVASAAGMLLASQSTYEGFIASPQPMDALIVGLIVLLLMVLFALLLLRPFPQLENPKFRRFGGTTYPLYLLHAGVGSTLIASWHPFESGLLTVLLSLGITVSLVALATSVIEERLVPLLAKSRAIARIAGTSVKREGASSAV